MLKMVLCSTALVSFFCLPAAAQRAHALYFLGLAERAAPALRGHAQRTWFLQLEREHEHQRARQKRQRRSRQRSTAAKVLR